MQQSADFDDTAKAGPRRSATTIRFSGEYDLTRKDELQEILGALPPTGRVAIDLSGVTYVDSCFLHELGALRLRYPQLAITLAGASSHLRRLFKIVGFDRIFEFR